MATTDLELHQDTLEALFSNDDRLDYLAHAAVRDALREHKRLGQSVAVWQDGKVVTLAPEDIPVDLTDNADGKQFEEGMTP
jgi:hypothetical protein